jgi:hypothetical protein
LKFQFESEEARELLALIVTRLAGDIKFTAKDRAALLRWHSDSMRAGSAGMRELTGKINEDIDRAIKTRSRSAVVKPDWK